MVDIYVQIIFAGLRNFDQGLEKLRTANDQTEAPMAIDPAGIDGISEGSLYFPDFS
jgi:hypothetical protein